MAVRESLLALLIDGPKHGYQLRVEHDAATVTGKPLNLGQVYSTLERLERDGLVVQTSGVDGEEGGDDRRKYFALTSEGRAAAERWFASPSVASERPARDELATKVVLALGAVGIDELAVMHIERLALVARLQAVRQEDDSGGDLAHRLLKDAAAARLEAEVAWLDRCEAQVRTARRRASAATKKVRGSRR